MGEEEEGFDLLDELYGCECGDFYGAAWELTKKFGISRIDAMGIIKRWVKERNIRLLKVEE